MLKIDTICEMGCGSGYIGILMIKKFNPSKMVLIDINKNALELTKENLSLNNISMDRIELMESNLFDNLNSEELKVDLLLFNPPYLPKELNAREFENDLFRLSWEGGDEIIDSFIEQSSSFLTKNGIIFLIVSNYQIKDGNIQKYVNKFDKYIHYLTSYKKRLVFETLYCLVFRKNQF